MNVRTTALIGLLSFSLPLAARSQTTQPAMAPPSAGNPAYPAVVRNETPAQREARPKWFREARFGMFIHWGVYGGCNRGWRNAQA